MPRARTLPDTIAYGPIAIVQQDLVNAIGNVTSTAQFVLLYPHCYLPNANHRKGPFSHVDITKDSNVMFWMDMPALVAPPELPQLEPLQLTMQQDWLNVTGNDTFWFPVTPHCNFCIKLAKNNQTPMRPPECQSILEQYSLCDRQRECLRTNLYQLLEC